MTACGFAYRARASKILVARYGQKGDPSLKMTMNIADLPVIALRIAHVARWGDLSAE
jgi:hypothetical protein